MQCPNCYRDLNISRTALPEHMLDEYFELEKLDPEAAEEFEFDNTEEFWECPNCGIVE